MFKLKALITTLVLGSSTAAIAAPFGFRGDDYYNDDRIRYQREDFGRDDDAGPRRYRPTWVALGQAELLDGRDVIRIDQRGTFTQLRIQADRGRSYVDHVIVRFRDGSRQFVPVRRRLDRGNRMFQFELDGNNRRISAVIIAGDSRRGAIDVFGI